MKALDDELESTPVDALQLVDDVESPNDNDDDGDNSGEQAPAATKEDDHSSRQHEQDPSTSLSPTPANGDDSTTRTSTAAERGPRPISKDYSNAPPPPTPPKLSINGKDYEGEQEEQAGEGAALEEDVPRPLSTAGEEEVDEAFEDVTLSSRAPIEVGEESKTPAQEDDAPPPPPPHSPTLPTPATPPPPSRSPALPTPPTDSPTPAQPTNGTSPATSRPISLASTTMNAPGSSTPSAARRSSVGSTTTISASGSSSLVSGILIISALESIAASKETKKSKPLKDAVDAALEALKNPVPSPSTSTAANANGTVDPLVIFTPLRLACETKSLPLMISALDCISKLVSYDFFHDDPAAPPIILSDSPAGDEGDAAPAAGDALSLADLLTTTICDCFSPSPSSSSSSSSSTSAANAPTTQHDTLLLRLLSSLLSLILSPSLSVHQSSLLKAVRTVYNVFLMGKHGTVQTVAQATLGQIVGGVFGRINVAEAAREGAGTGGEEVGSAGASKVDLGTVEEVNKVEEELGELTPKVEQSEVQDEGEQVVEEEGTGEPVAQESAENVPR